MARYIFMFQAVVDSDTQEEAEDEARALIIDERYEPSSVEIEDERVTQILATNDDDPEFDRESALAAIDAQKLDAPDATFTVTIVATVPGYITDDQIAGAAAAAQVQIHESDRQEWEGATNVSTFVAIERGTDHTEFDV